MKRKVLWCGLSLMLVAALVLASCGEAALGEQEEEEEEKEEPKHELQPVEVAEWSGSANKTTEPFTMNSSPWAISWTFEPGEPILGIYANYFSATIQKPDNVLFAELPANIANVKQSVSEVSYIYSTGTFYIDISCLDGRWAIKVFSYE